MGKNWGFSIIAEPEKGRIIKISDWSDLSVFLLCHWPVKHGSSYTAAVCSLSQDFYKKSNIKATIRLFIAALNEAEIPYKLVTPTSVYDHTDTNLSKHVTGQTPLPSL